MRSDSEQPTDHHQAIDVAEDLQLLPLAQSRSQRCRTRVLWVLPGVTAILLVAVVVLSVDRFRGGDDHSDAGAGPRPLLSILQINDVYEMELGNTSLARVATLWQQLRRDVALFVLAGDFISPSGMGMAVVNGKPLYGLQMVDVLNRIGLQYVCMGNHEFDLGPEALQAAINHSDFQWITTNVFRTDGSLFPHTLSNATLVLPSGLRLGFIGLTTDESARSWRTVLDFTASLELASRTVAALRSEYAVDVVVALTHWSVEQDQQLAEEVPVDIIIGGHEHVNYHMWRREQSTHAFISITKADANAKTAYIHSLYAPATEGSHIPPSLTTPAVSVRSTLQPVDSSIPADAQIQAVIDVWTAEAFAALRQQGFDPTAVLVKNIAPPGWDATDSSVRARATDFTRIVADSMRRGVQNQSVACDLALYNGGSIRVDEILTGTFTEYDALRALPFPNYLVAANLSGAVLVHALSAGLRNTGSGGFLQHTSNVKQSADGNNWLVNDAPVDPSAPYTVASTDFLLSGGERNLHFLNWSSPGVTEVPLPFPEHAIERDLRFVLSWFLLTAPPP